ncbi:hypothetical protein B0O80DRAFT_472034 [Mortierella sp. GBAus27b]|nr:hypothetical protein B0O80DRAFT_472034 [Mortierella sp. GBAus27b]
MRLSNLLSSMLLLSMISLSLTGGGNPTPPTPCKDSSSRNFGHCESSGDCQVVDPRPECPVDRSLHCIGDHEGVMRCVNTYQYHAGNTCCKVPDEDPGDVLLENEKRRRILRLVSQ